MIKKILLSLFIVIAVLLTLAVTSLFFAPAIGLHLANHWYSQQGEGYQLEAESWQFSPFSTRLNLKNVLLTHPKQAAGTTQLAELQLTLSPKHLLHKHLVIEQIKLKGFEMDVKLVRQAEEQELNLAGLTFPLTEENISAASNQDEAKKEAATDEEAGLPLAIKLEQLSLEDLVLTWQVTDTTAVEELTTQGKLKLNSFQLANLDSEVITDIPLSLHLEIAEFSLNSATNLQLHQPLKIHLQGELTDAFNQPSWLGEVEINQIDAAISTSQLEEALTLSAKQLAIEKLNLTLTDISLAKAKLSELKLAADNNWVELPELELIKLTASQQEQQLQKLIATNLNLTTADEQLHLPKLALHNLSIESLIAQLEAIHVMDLSFTSPAKQLTVNLPRLEAKQVVALIEEENYSLASLEAHNLEISEQNSQVYLSRFTLNNANYSLNQPNIELIRLEDLAAKQRANKQTSQLNLINLELLGLKSDLEQQTFSLDKLVIAATEDALSKFIFTDFNVKPRAKVQLKIHQLAVNEITGQLNELGQPVIAPADFNLHLGVGEFGDVTGEGKLGLISLEGASYPEGKFNLIAKQLDGVDFNGYLIQALGYQLDHGSLNFDAAIAIQQAKLNGQVNLLVRNSKFTPADEKTIDRISKQISMPLETSLNLLRNKQGNLVLNLELSGDLNHPEFSWQPLINKVTTKALRAASVFMLKQSLQPFSTFVSLGYLAGEYAFAIRLNALDFVEQEAELTEEHLAALQKLGELLQNKPKLEVRACPFVSHEEVEQLGERQGQNLASNRGLAVKTWLEEHFPNEAERVTRCRPQQGKRAEVVLGVN